MGLARDQHNVDVCIANGENAAGGFGLTVQTADEMFAAGVDFITSGNHIFDKREFVSYLNSTDRIIRPVNYPPGVPGHGPPTERTRFAMTALGRTALPLALAATRPWQRCELPYQACGVSARTSGRAVSPEITGRIARQLPK